MGQSASGAGIGKPLRRTDALLPILGGLFIHVLARGRVAESLRWVARMQEAAETFDDADLVIAGHSIAVRAYLWLGDLIKTREHVNRVLALYSEGLHGHLVGILNQDPKTFSLVCSAISTLMLGYPDQAAQVIEDGEAHARKLGHPFDLAWVLTCIGAEFFDHIRAR